MQKLCKRKVLHGKKRDMYRICKKAKKKVWKIWQKQRERICFALMILGVAIMIGCEESVKEGAFTLQQGFWWIAIGAIPAYIGAKGLES